MLITVAPSPATHSTGLVVGILIPVVVGCETHMMDVWEPAEGLRRIEKYRCSTTATATPFVRMALDAAPAAGADVSSMGFWLCAGAPIPESLAQEFEGVFTNGRLIPLYGSTETLATTCCHLDDPIEKCVSSDGSPALAGVQIKLADAEGNEVPQGEEGEILYWGPGAILGYWRDPERTAATIDSGGSAVVVAKGGEPLSLDEVTGYMRTELQVSPTKLPERLVVVDEMPMTPTGKIQKFRLRELARQKPGE